MQQNGPDPADFFWVMSKVEENDSPLLRGVDKTYYFVLFNVPKPGTEMEKDEPFSPDIRVRCFSCFKGDESWCEVRISYGDAPHMHYPRPDLFTHSKEQIIRRFEAETGKTFPTDIRLYVHYSHWEPIEEV